MLDLLLALSLAPATIQDPPVGQDPLGGYVATGPVEVTATAARRQTAVRVPMTHRDWGRLTVAVDQPRHRIEAGALVYRARFGMTGAATGLVYDAWCGQGQVKRFFNFAPGVVCIIDTADGRAALTEGLTDGAWWNPQTLSSIENGRIDRPSPTPAPNDAVPMALEVEVFQIREDTVVVARRTLDGEGKTVGSQPIRWLPVIGGGAVYEVPGHLVRLAPAADRQSVAVTTAPLDMAVIDAATAMVRAEERQARELTPFVIGATRIDPSALTVATGVVERRGVLVSGSGTRARNARITAEKRAGAGIQIAEGAHWHYVEQPPMAAVAGTSTQRGYWCGPARIVSILGSVDATYCAGQPAAGPMQLYPALGEPWLSGTFLTSTVGPVYLDSLPLAEIETDPLPPFRFEIVVRDVNDRRVRLQARGWHDEKQVPIWYGDFDWVDGRVEVPMWSHTLILTRSGRGVTAVLEARETVGDGLSSVGALPSPHTLT